MINILGFKRVVVLLILLALNALLGATIYGYLMPEVDKKEREMRTLRSQTNTVRADIDQLLIEFEQFEDQKAQFEIYKNDGFFAPQNRREIVDLLQLIQEKSGVTAAKVAVNPAVVEDNEEAAKANHKILRSTIQVQLEALDDKDIFHYIYLANKSFPGHISVEELNFERDSEVNGTILRAIASGKTFPLVQSEISMV